MMHGEDLARAHGGGNGSMRMPADVIGGSAARQYDGQTAKAPSAPSISTIMRSAGLADELIGERVKVAFHLAERAESIATRLAGSYPARAPSDSALDRRPDGETSGFAAMQSAVDGISQRARSADPALERLSLALDQIERTLG